jgi:predicted RNA polymerase sigma factor
MNDPLLRDLVPAVTGILVRRGADFAPAEDAVQEALVRALETWPGGPPRDPKAWLLALMLLHHARRASRAGPGGRLVPLGEQDRSRWDAGLIAEGVTVLQAALARDRLGEYQAQAAIAALHADAPSAAETDWVQITEWYDELLRLTGGSPVVRLNRAVAVGEAGGPQAGLAALDGVDPALPRCTAVTAYLRERAGDLEEAAGLYAAAARAAASAAERDHLTREAARVRQLPRLARRGAELSRRP